MENKKTNNVRVIELAKYESPIITESNREDWIEFGADNNYFQYLIDRYTYSPTNNAIINNIVKLVYGKGIKALDASAKVMDWAQMMTIFDSDCTKKFITDLKMLGQYAFQVHYSKDRKTIIKALHIPIHLLRPEKCDADGIIQAYYYSDNWLDTKEYVPKRIPAFGMSKEEIEILYIQPYSVGLKYFSLVDYQGALPYTVLEQDISDYLINEVQNGFSGTKIVNFNNSVPSEEEMDDIERRVVGKVTGAKGKRVIVSFNSDEKYKTTVDDIPLNDAPAHYEYLSDECMRKIMLGHNVTSPLLFGISSSNGFSSNADELKNSFILYYNMVILPFQEEILKGYDKILAYNGISLKLYFDTLKPLEFTDANGEVQQEDNQNLSKINASKEEDNAELLISLGERPKDNWVLIDEHEVDYQTDEEHNANLSKLNTRNKTALSSLINLVTTGTARPNAKSQQDEYIDGIKFITRYIYSGELKSNSRSFCKKMINSEKVYRKEDIVQMSSQEVNKGWGPKGSSTYDIWHFKGGGACHHIWKKQVYVAFDSSVGIDVYSPLARKLAVAKAEKAGYVIINENFVDQRPVDMPNQGFLPTNKRFKWEKHY